MTTETLNPAAEKALAVDPALFAFAEFDAVSSERTGYSDYSYWKSTFRVFLKNKVALLLLVFLAGLLLFTIIQPFLPGLQAVSYVLLDNAEDANWGLLLSLAMAWLNEGRYSQVLCAQLDHRSDLASGHWLSLSRAPGTASLARLAMAASEPSGLPDIPELPARIAHWLASPGPSRRQLESPAGRGQTVEFARL